MLLQYKVEKKSTQVPIWNHTPLEVLGPMQGLMLFSLVGPRSNRGPGIFEGPRSNRGPDVDMIRILQPVCGYHNLTLNQDEMGSTLVLQAGCAKRPRCKDLPG